MHSDHTLTFKRICVGGSTGGHDPRLRIRLVDVNVYCLDFSPQFLGPGWLFNTCRLNAASRTARCSSMFQSWVVSSLARWETAASATAIFALSSPCFTSINAARYGFCHFGYFMCLSSIKAPRCRETRSLGSVFSLALKLEKVDLPFRTLASGLMHKVPLPKLGEAEGCV